MGVKALNDSLGPNGLVPTLLVFGAYPRMAEIMWIEGESNPADSMTKSKCGTALKGLIDSNKIDLKINAWIDRRNPPENPPDIALT